METIKILIIEDDEKTFNHLRRIINTFLSDVEIIHATNKSTALAELKTGLLSLVILDGQLSDDDHGKDILKEMSNDQIKKTVIHSSDIAFINESTKAGIKTIDKDCRDLFKEVENVLQEQKII